MKRFFQLIISAMVIGILCLMISHWFKSKDNTHANEKLYVYNWGEYIDPSLIKK
ncbi:MAG: spermidine/putrescine ABC transporter substrate-binding protein, partial [Staphylococcus sp.]|nr:spermidine/putrescine ABC transporter substrate-binding protein [Staphylococcus sp.]